jgi:DNA-binding response OmpR family regulator
LIAMPTRVLVIDDEAPIRLLCRVNLEAEGMEVLEAPDGSTGVELANAHSPDVILLDVMMPRADGWQVAEELIDGAETRGIPIMFLTARAELGERASQLDSVGLDTITKPFNPVDLARVVDEFLDRTGPVASPEVRRKRIADLRGLIERS